VSKISTWLKDNAPLVCNPPVMATLLNQARDGDYQYYRRYTRPDYFLFGLMLRQPWLAKQLLTDMVEMFANDQHRVPKSNYSQRAQVMLTSLNEPDVHLHTAAMSIALLVTKHMRRVGYTTPRADLMQWLRSEVSYDTWKSGFAEGGTHAALRG